MVPVNRVHAMDLQRALQQEYSKEEWRLAMQENLRRYQENGGKVQRLAPAAERTSYSRIQGRLGSY